MTRGLAWAKRELLMGTTDSALVAAGNNNRRLSSAGRIAGIFYAPGAVFEDIGREPHMFLCMGLEALLAFLGGWVVLNRVGVNAILQQNIAQSGRPAPPPQAMAAAAMGIRVSFLLAPLGVVLMLLVLAGLFLGCVNFILGQELRYKTMLAVTAHAWLPLLALANVLAMIAILLSAHPHQFAILNPLATNISFFFDPATTPKVLYVAGQQFDVLVLWALGLLALGIHKVGQNVKLGSALGLVGGMWGLWLLVRVAIAALM